MADSMQSLDLNLSSQNLENIQVDAFHYGMSPVINRAAIVNHSIHSKNGSSELSIYTPLNSYGGQKQTGKLRTSTSRESQNSSINNNFTEINRDQVKLYIKKINSKDVMERLGALNNIKIKDSTNT